MKTYTSQQIVNIWVSHYDAKGWDELAQEEHDWNDKKVREAVYKMTNELSWAETIPYDHSRKLVDQLNEILKDETVIEVYVKDDTPNPNLDGANCLLWWRAIVNRRDLTENGIYFLTINQNKAYVELVK